MMDELDTLKEELTASRQLNRVQELRYYRLVSRFQTRMRAKEEENRFDLLAKNAQLTRVLRSLYIVEAKLRQEYKMLKGTLQNRDSLVRRQEAEIHTLKAELERLRSVQSSSLADKGSANIDCELLDSQKNRRPPLSPTSSLSPSNTFECCTSWSNTSPGGKSSSPLPSPAELINPAIEIARNTSDVRENVVLLKGYCSRKSATPRVDGGEGGGGAESENRLRYEEVDDEEEDETISESSRSSSGGGGSSNISSRNSSRNSSDLSWTKSMSEEFNKIGKNGNKEHGGESEEDSGVENSSTPASSLILTTQELMSTSISGADDAKELIVASSPTPSTTPVSPCHSFPTSASTPVQVSSLSDVQEAQQKKSSSKAKKPAVSQKPALVNGKSAAGGDTTLADTPYSSWKAHVESEDDFAGNATTSSGANTLAMREKKLSRQQQQEHADWSERRRSGAPCSMTSTLSADSAGSADEQEQYNDVVESLPTVSQMVRKFENMKSRKRVNGRSKFGDNNEALLSTSQTKLDNDIMQKNFEEFHLVDNEIESTYEDVTKLNGTSQTDMNRNGLTSSTPAFFTGSSHNLMTVAEESTATSKTTSISPMINAKYESFLEMTGLCQKSILTPSRTFSNHRNVVKPKDVKYRSRVKSAVSVISDKFNNSSNVTKPLTNTSPSMKYWTEPYL